MVEFKREELVSPKVSLDSVLRSNQSTTVFKISNCESIEILMKDIKKRCYNSHTDSLQKVLIKLKSKLVQCDGQSYLCLINDKLWDNLLVSLIGSKTVGDDYVSYPELLFTESEKENVKFIRADYTSVEELSKLLKQCEGILDRGKIHLTYQFLCSNGNRKNLFSLYIPDTYRK